MDRLWQATLILLFSTCYCPGQAQELALEIPQDDLILTGSGIQTLNEGPSPIVVLTGEDIRQQGYNSLYDALRALSSALGKHQSEQLTPVPRNEQSIIPPAHQGLQGFTPNAQELNLRGFGASRTLVLLNGQRVADAPEVLDGRDNFFNFAIIPLSAVKRVEILTGSASAIYGSDAVVGVINVILKRDVDGFAVASTYGTTYEGGGDSAQLSVESGYTWDKGNLTFITEFDRRAPVFGADRSYLDSVQDGPQDLDAIRDVFVIESRPFVFFPSVFQSPPNGETTCRQFDNLILETRQEEDGPRGISCQREAIGLETLRNRRERSTSLFHFDYSFNEKLSIFTDVLWWHSEADVRPARLELPRQILIPDGGSPTIVRRVFGPGETGNQDIHFDEQFVFATLGFSGSLTENIDFNLALVTSEARQRREQLQLKASETLRYFQQDLSRIWQITPQETMSQLAGLSTTVGHSQSLGINSQLITELGALHNKPVWLSVTGELYKNSYSIDADDRSKRSGGSSILAPAWINFVAATGEGERMHGALSVEALVPLLTSNTLGNMELQLAARFDHYEDKAVDSDTLAEPMRFEEPTFKTGLSYRPDDSLLIRATYGTSFRAPGMHNLYAGALPEATTIVDTYDCRRQLDNNTPPVENFDINISCGFDDVEDTVGIVAGSKNLREESGYSATAGIAWSPMSNASFAIDFYHFKIKNIVDGQQRFQDVLNLEADCRLGEDTDGNAVDTQSTLCRQTIAQVARASTETNDGLNINRIYSSPTQSALFKQSGMDITADYRVHSIDLGEIGFSLQYSYLHDFTQKQSIGQGDADLLRGPNANTLRSKTKMTTSWHHDQWTASITNVYQGSLPVFSREEGEPIELLRPTIKTNVYLAYRFFDATTLSLSINNLTNQRPPVDNTYTQWPFFERGHYDAIGREFLLRFEQKF